MPLLNHPVWKPSPEAVAASNLTAFMRFVHSRYCVSAGDYGELHRWSIEQLEDFWTAVWDFSHLIADSRGERALIDGDRMQGASFFPDARLNFAQNLLRRRDECDAIVFRGENKARRRLSRQQLYDEVSRFAQALRHAGVQPGDRVAAYLPNLPETVIAMLATASIGAVWTSCSPDFGPQGVIDRFGQVGAKVFVACDGYFGSGKKISTLDAVREVVARLPTVEIVVMVSYVQSGAEQPAIDRAVGWAEFVGPFTAADIDFAQLPFNHPLVIAYSSGTTGVPKCIVHRAGGILLTHAKEHRLHCDIKAEDRVFYYTTCGWMMWNWLVSALAADATVMLYDGSPFLGRGSVLFDFAAEEKITHFGVSAKYLDAIAKLRLRPAATHNLDAMRMLLSTGSPLSPEGFEYVYRDIKPDLCLASISGGTDILACFAGGCPIRPVWRGELQCRLLGMAVEVVDENGKPVRGQKGELVCTRPFPSMPLGFWNDPGDRRYAVAYFERFANIWTHGDYCEITVHDGLIIHGRSDAVLNPGGVRIGTAEIYRQVEKLDEIEESLAIGQDWPPAHPRDVRVVLFVRLKPGIDLDDALTRKIRETIRANTTPRHVPAKIVQVPDIPRTRSGKIVELAVRNIVHGVPVRNQESLANAEALRFFANMPELET
ncbi:MAG: acetoacetate--CoA ligase [Betaproteobacteria bacterium]